MLQRVNLHIGYHKTGTTTFQEAVSAHEKEFKYWGRSKGSLAEGGHVIDNLASAIFQPSRFESVAARARDSIVRSGADLNLVSHENLLRPHPNSFRNLNYLVSLLTSVLDVEVFVSRREEEEELILSRFMHDYRVTQKKDIRHISADALVSTLRNSLTWDTLCYYPNCKQRLLPLCSCGNQKKIPVAFYSQEELSKRISFPITYVDLIGQFGKPAGSRSNEFRRLVFDNAIDFNKRENVAIRLPELTEKILIEEIRSFLETR